MSENIFERVAEVMQMDQHKAFVGNPSSKRFFQLNYSTEAKVIETWTPKKLDDKFLEKRFQVRELNFGYASNRIDQQ